MSALQLSRPTTPESPLTSSYYHAATTVDDLTIALTNFSRVPSPEPSTTLLCCCGQDECENLKSWTELKSRLQSRLVLSAEVGQALLQRHEAYVRANERRKQQPTIPLELTTPEGDGTFSVHPTNESLQHHYDELVREKAAIEKRLNQALVNNEVTEVSNKTILQELQDARDTISRLTAHHARSVGWDTRLSAALKERDDMQQERDGETHRARLAESRFAALKDKTAKLQAEVRRLQVSLEEQRLSRLESSETLLQDARTRIESVRTVQTGLNAKIENDELTSVMELLVNDNEILKKDNAELQNLLAESREDLHALQEEVEEQRANLPPPRSGAVTPQSRHGHTSSVPSISLKDFTPYTPAQKNRRNISIDFRNKQARLSPGLQEPLTPEASRYPLSPADSLAPSESKWAGFGQISPKYPASRISFDIEEDAEENGDSSEMERKRTHRPLMLLSRSRGVQTDAWPSGGLSPSPFPSQLSSISPHDPRSESSSFSESPPSQIFLILERVAALHNRLSQADALTLTNRLKRQHLRGADVGHLSRSTVNSILSEANAIRTQFRGFLEDEKAVSTCTRKDLRLLFKFVKDVFSEMGQMRITLNDIILDPASAIKVSEMALNPGKVDAVSREKDNSGLAGAAGWIAPISKLFSPTGRNETAGEGVLPVRTSGQRLGSHRTGRLVPKLGPALAASTTTVNVEFSGTMVGRAVTSSYSADPIPASESSSTIFTQGSSSGVMGIFAGAPQKANPLEPDPWVVLPSAPPNTLHRSHSSLLKGKDPEYSTATVGRVSGRKSLNRFSRNVDAVIDVDQHPQEADEDAQDFLPPLLERTLRRRGLSDSSIHSSFANQEEGRGPALPPSPTRPSLVDSALASPLTRVPAWPDRSTVFQAFSRTMQNFRATAASTLTPLTLPPAESTEQSSISNPLPVPAALPASLLLPADPVPQSPIEAVSASITSTPPQTPTRKAFSSKTKPMKVASPAGGRSRTPAWAVGAGDEVIDPLAGADPFIASSLRDESLLQRIARTRGGGEGHSREFL